MSPAGGAYAGFVIARLRISFPKRAPGKFLSRGPEAADLVKFKVG